MTKIPSERSTRSLLVILLRRFWVLIKSKVKSCSKKWTYLVMEKFLTLSSFPPLFLILNFLTKKDLLCFSISQTLIEIKSCLKKTSKISFPFSSNTEIRIWSNFLKKFLTDLIRISKHQSLSINFWKKFQKFNINYF